MTAKQRTAEIETTRKMLDNERDFIRRFPTNPYVAKREAQIAQMEARLNALASVR